MRSSKELRVEPAAARRFLLRSHGFVEPFRDIDAAMAHHGYVQIDPINVCGRMHDLILRNRIAGYREGDLMRHLHGSAWRTAFEHHLPHSNVLVAFSPDAWPHLLGAMQARTRISSAWSGRLTPRERALVEILLAEIRARGPLGSADFEDRGKSRSVWGQATLVKSTLQKLFFHGRLLIGARVNNHRKYDLPERILSPKVLSLPPASESETLRWVALLKLRQFRLAQLKRNEARAAADAIQEVTIEGCPQVYCLREDAAELAESGATSPKSAIGRVRRAAAGSRLRSAADTMRLIAPLDPLIYQRNVTRGLWDYDYTWEVYTPPAKRVRGYYALPVLSGAELVGHVDPKADRKSGLLHVVSSQIRPGHRHAPAVRDFARWLGLKPGGMTSRNGLSSD